MPDLARKGCVDARARLSGRPPVLAAPSSVSATQISLFGGIVHFYSSGSMSVRKGARSKLRTSMLTALTRTGRQTFPAERKLPPAHVLRAALPTMDLPPRIG